MHIQNMEFAEYRHESTDPRGTKSTERYLHDSRALNADWKRASDLSSLVVSTDTDHGKSFVEFLFNADCYRRISVEKSEIIDDWKAQIFKVTESIEEAKIKATMLDELPADEKLAQANA